MIIRRPPTPRRRRPRRTISRFRDRSPASPPRRPARRRVRSAQGDHRRSALQAFVRENGPVARPVKRETEDAFLLKCVAAAGQAHVLRVTTNDPVTVVNKLRPLVRTLRNVRGSTTLGKVSTWGWSSSTNNSRTASVHLPLMPQRGGKGGGGRRRKWTGSEGEGVVEDDGCVKLFPRDLIREDGGALPQEPRRRVSKNYRWPRCILSARDRLGLVDDRQWPPRRC